jgi:hypothetical protein
MKNLSFIYVCLAFFFAINLISENNESETLTLATVEKSFNDLMSNIDLNNRQKSEIRKNIVTQLQSLIDQDALNDPDQLSTALTIATNSALSSQQTESQIRKLKLAIEKKINNTGAPNNSLSTGLAETPVKKTPHELLVLKFKKQLQKVTDYTLSNENNLRGTRWVTLLQLILMPLAKRLKLILIYLTLLFLIYLFDIPMITVCIVAIFPCHRLKF